MTLFKNKSRYPDLSSGYELYCNRSVKTPKDRILDRVLYNRIVKAFCKELADELEKDGIVDLPSDIGSVIAVGITKKPSYDVSLKKYRSADNVDWDATRKNGTVVRKDGNKTFGFVFQSKRVKGHGNFRCFGIRANKALYKRMRKCYDEGTLNFSLTDSELYLI